MAKNNSAAIGCGTVIVALIVLGAIVRWIESITWADIRNVGLFVAALIGIFLIVGIVGVAHDDLAKAKRRQVAEKQRQEEEKQREMEQDTERMAGAAFRVRVEQMLSELSNLVVDANIWMNPGYHSSLSELAIAAHNLGKPLRLHPAVFEELVRLKDTASSERSARARAALRLVDALQEQCLFAAVDRMSREPIPRAYADGVFIRMVENVLAGERIAILTDDRELKIRLRSRAASNAKVLDGSDLELDRPRSTAWLAGFRNSDVVETGASASRR